MCGGVHSTRPSEGAELQRRGPRKCTVGEQGPQQSTNVSKDIFSRKQYKGDDDDDDDDCTGAEECVVGSTAPVRRGGAELQGRGPRKCTVKEQGLQQSTVRGRRMCGGVHNTRPSGGG